MEYHRVSWNVMEYHGVCVAYVQPALAMHSDDHSDDHLGRPTMEPPARTKSNPNVDFTGSVTVLFLFHFLLRLTVLLKNTEFGKFAPLSYTQNILPPLAS